MARKQAYRVIRATQRQFTNIDLGGGHGVNLSPSNNSALVTDAGKAKDVEQRFGQKGQQTPGEVIVVPVNIPVEPGHRYSFVVPELPWKKEKKA